MSGSLNKVLLVGNLGRDPEIRETKSGDRVATLSVATSERWRDQSGETQERTEWHRVVYFGKTAEIAERYLKKGSKVLVEGKLQTRKWTDDKGQDRYSTEIMGARFGGLTLLDRREDRDSYGGGAQSGASSFPDDGGAADDDIPF